MTFRHEEYTRRDVITLSCDGVSCGARRSFHANLLAVASLGLLLLVLLSDAQTVNADK
jgi:hypothetical protein